jgi:hypothetical protein
MSEFGDLDRRMTTLEKEMRQLREDSAVARGDATAARILAAGAHKDVGDALAKWDAHIQTINAIREDQLDLKKRVDGLEVKVDAGFAEVKENFAMLNVGMAQIVALLTAKEDEEKED